MALKTTVAAGLASNTATWNGGTLPAVGDDIQQDHDLTWDIATAITDYVQASTGVVLTIDINAVLTFRGELLFNNDGTKRSNLIMLPGARIRFDAANQSGASAGKVWNTAGATHARFETQGTLANPCYFEQFGSGARKMLWSHNDNGNQTPGMWSKLRYTRFVNVDIDDPWLGYGGTGNAEFDWENVHFDSLCSRVQFISNADAGSATGGVYRFVNVVHMGGNGTESLRIAGTANGAAIALIENCFFEQALNIVEQEGWSIAPGNVLWGGMGSTAANKPACAQFEGVFRRSIYNDQQYAIGNDTSVYDLIDNQSVGDNPHPIVSPFGFNYTRTDCHMDPVNPAHIAGDMVGLLNPPAPTVTTLVRETMGFTPAGLSAGKILSALGGANNSMAMLHCTFASDDSPGNNSECGLGLGETYNGHVGMVTNFKSNLAVSLTAGRAVLVAGANHANKVANMLPPANATHNATMNGKTGTTSGVTGFHDYQVTTPFWSGGTLNANGVYLTGTPQVVDPTRNAYKWAVTRGQAESLAGLKIVLMRSVDWTDANYDPATANKPLALLTWVRDGFQVTDAALQNAGHDGVTIGAMPYSTAPGVPSVTGPAAIAHGDVVALTVTNFPLGDRTVAVVQGGVTIAQTETSGNATTVNLTALFERVDPLTSLRRTSLATVRVTRTSDSAFAEYLFTVANVGDQLSINPVTIAASPNLLVSTPPWIIGDQLQARGVGGAALPGGFALYADGTAGDPVGSNFEFRVYDSITNTVSAWALQTVSVGVAPAITVQPTNQTVADGAAFSFSIVATGDAPLAYQWTDDGANVGTDSPTYAGTASLAMNGSTIRVTVSNAYGSVLSSAVTLTVTGVISPPGPITGLAVTAITATGATVSYNSTPTATSYEYTLDGTNWVNVGLVLSFPLSGLTQFTNYSVAVRAVNSGGTGAQSSAPFKTLDAQPPTSPQDLMETTIGATTATFSFTAATDNAAVTGYRYRVDGGTYVNIGVSFSFSVSGLSAGSAHLVEVVAYDAAGNVSFPAARSFTTSTLSAPITNVDDIRFHVRGLFKRFVNEGESLAVRVYCRAGKYPATPTQIRYRISCANTDECLQDWQTTTPASVVDVLIPAELNRLRSQWHWFEQRALTVEATNADGSVRISEYRYFVQNVIGVD
jgi:hypothetical protein